MIKDQSIIFDNISEIEVIGGGLFGILIAYNLSKSEILKNLGIKISLVERSNNLLPNWNNKEINGYKVNNGFYAIEMPRAEITISDIKEMIGDNFLLKSLNCRYISINSNVLNFKDSIVNWPEDIKDGLDEFLKKRKNIIPSEDEKNNYARNNLDKYKLGKIIKKCFKRYSSDLNQSWGQFYPWFYPSEFLFTDDNESSIFYKSIQEGKLSPYSLQPKNGLFSELSPFFLKKLQAKGVEIKLNKIYELPKNDEKKISKDKLTIWATSSYHLLSQEPSIKSRINLENKRFLYLLLYKTSKKTFDNFIGLKKNPPAEILCLEEKSPGLSRISFPKSKNNSDLNKLILIENYSDEYELNKSTINQITISLENIINGEVELIGKTLGRSISSLNQDASSKAERILTTIIQNKNIIIPKVFWGPINIARCGIYTKQFCKDFIHKFKNK